jgi:hypothetical protein
LFNSPSRCYSAPAQRANANTPACACPLTLVGRVVLARTRGVTAATRLPLSYPSPLVNSAATTSSIPEEGMPCLMCHYNSCDGGWTAVINEQALGCPNL